MLTKLLKYDFKSLFRVMIPIYIVSFLLAILTRGLNLLTERVSIFSIPSAFISALFVFSIIAIPLLTFVYTILKFYQNLIKDEGYLMHTLPVSKNSLVLSKSISALCFLAISCFVAIGILFTGVYGIWFDHKVFSLFGEMWGIINHNFIILIVILMALGFIMQQIMYYAAIALGQKHNSKKIVYSIVYGIVLYNINQIASVILLLPMMFSSKYQKYLQMDMPPMDFMNGYLIANIILSVLFVLLYHYLTVRTLEKKLNLE